MPKKKRNHNIRTVRARRSYSISEIASLFNVHVRTVQAWHKTGLVAIDEVSKPFLFMGSEIKRFLSERKTARRHKLKEDEFYCPRCRTGRVSMSDKIAFVESGKKIGKDDMLILIKGKCKICGCNLIRFCTKNKLKHSFFCRFLTKHARIIKGNQLTTLNTDIIGVKDNEK